MKNTKFSRGALAAIAACLVLVLIPAFGCRKSHKLDGTVAAEGVVLYEDLPLAWATVTLAPASSKDAAPGANRVANGMTDQDGHFTLQTIGTEGAQPGEYVVLVEKFIPKEKGGVANWEKARAESGYKEPEPQEVEVAEDGTIPEAESAIPLKYSEKKTSPLRVTVSEGGSKDLKVELYKNK